MQIYNKQVTISGVLEKLCGRRGKMLEEERELFTLPCNKITTVSPADMIEERGKRLVDWLEEVTPFLCPDWLSMTALPCSLSSQNIVENNRGSVLLRRSHRQCTLSLYFLYLHYQGEVNVLFVNNLIILTISSFLNCIAFGSVEYYSTQGSESNILLLKSLLYSTQGSHYSLLYSETHFSTQEVAGVTKISS